MSESIRLVVAIPTFQRREQVVRVAREVLAQLRDGDEFIISDDGSSDGTIEELGKLKGINVHRQSSNLGMVGNWNYCLAAGSCQWVCMLHDDDRLMPGALNAIRRVCATAVGPSLIAHSAWHSPDQYGDSETLWYEFREPGKQACLQSDFCPSGVTIHRSVVQCLGGFSSAFAYSADVEFFARVCARFPSFVIRNPRIIEYVLHDSNYQYQTWKEPDFLNQFELVESTAISYAGLDADSSNALVQARMSGNLLHMLRTARRLGDSGVVRRVSRRLREMSGLGRRMRAATWLGAKCGWYPRRLVR